METLTVVTDLPARLVVDARDGTVVSGGTLRVSAASVSHGGITLTIGGPADRPAAPADTSAAAQQATAAQGGIVRTNAGASVQEIAAALHAGGARPRDVASFLEALSAVGALRATVVVR